MAVELKLPLLGDVMREGTLVAWLLPDGARVEKGQPLYHLETDKVTLDVEAPESGILEQLAAPGSTVPVGAVVGRLLAPPATTGGSSGPGHEVRATPAARRLARELGVDLVALPVTEGRLREADVQAYHQAHAEPATTPAEAPAAAGVALSGRRAVIAERLLASLHQMAQLTISLEVDVTAGLALRDQLTRLWAPQGLHPTITDFVVLAAALALREHPGLNATLEAGRLIRHQTIDLGLAVDAEEGLIVPVLRGVDQRSLAEVVAEARRLTERARAGALSLAELHGGTFSVTSLGALGVDFFTPIVNPPQVAILGIGRVFTRLALLNGRVEERQALYLNLSFDHRAVDGAPAARFLNRVKEVLELPAGLLAQGMKLPPLTSSAAPTQ